MTCTVYQAMRKLSSKTSGMTDFEVGDHVRFAGGRGEVTKIEERPNGGHLLHVHTPEGQLRKLPSGLSHIEKLDSEHS